MYEEKPNYLPYLVALCWLLLVPLFSFGQSVSGPSSAVAGQEVTFSFSGGSACEGYQELNWSINGATVLECIQTSHSPCQQIRVRFNEGSYGTQYCSVYYTCSSGTNNVGEVHFTVELLPPPPPPITISITRNYMNTQSTFIEVSNVPQGCYYLLITYMGNNGEVYSQSRSGSSVIIGNSVSSVLSACIRACGSSTDINCAY